ncbi:hypothetical protein E5163_10355 [Marinicauda algicola]|uniref:Uncharacterized protein n=1 Tax=Marinicauda algicola TaxID=2029849 RepID=A0A4S2GYP7_9PROT|nr:hypothetical protein [Marinicauda algicola]TGY88224.1 hypothetical protein E5163_10355 [Marinicauda algicola]
MSDISREEFRRNMHDIAEFLYKGNSTPRKILEAGRENDAFDWEPNHERESFELQRGEFLDVFDEAVDSLSKK